MQLIIHALVEYPNSVKIQRLVKKVDTRSMDQEAHVRQRWRELTWIKLTWVRVYINKRKILNFILTVLMRLQLQDLCFRHLVMWHKVRQWVQWKNLTDTLEQKFIGHSSWTIENPLISASHKNWWNKLQSKRSKKKFNTYLRLSVIV